MKILLVVPEYPPASIGGGGEVFKNLAKNYATLGHEVVVLFGYFQTQSWKEKIVSSIQEGIKLYQIPEIPYPPSKPFLKTAMPPTLFGWWRIKKVIREENPEIAHVHGYGHIFIDIASFYLKKYNIPYITTIHGYPETPKKRSFPFQASYKLYERFSARQTLKYAQKITCVSNFVQKDKRNFYKEKSVVIYNGINIDEFRKDTKSINIRQKHHINEKTKIIFSLGRIAESKGFQEIIKRLPRFLEKDIPVKYLIAGRDEGYKKELERIARANHVENYVEFVGFLDNSLKKQYLSQCDIFAIPSFIESFGLIALEGMFFNKLILANNAAGLQEVLQFYPNKICFLEENWLEQIQNKKMDFSYNLEKFDWNNISVDYLYYLTLYAKK